jgi:hypothetical protein
MTTTSEAGLRVLDGAPHSHAAGFPCLACRLIFALALLALGGVAVLMWRRTITLPIPASPQEPDVQPWDERTYTLVSGGETIIVPLPPSSWTT